MGQLSKYHKDRFLFENLENAIRTRSPEERQQCNSRFIDYIVVSEYLGLISTEFAKYILSSL